MSRILANWETLQAYTSARREIPAHQRVDTDKMSLILGDTLKKALFKFVCPFVKQFEQINKQFQTTSVYDAQKANENLQRYAAGLRSRVYDREGRQRSLQVGTLTLRIYHKLRVLN